MHVYQADASTAIVRSNQQFHRLKQASRKVDTLLQSGGIGNADISDGLNFEQFCHLITRLLETEHLLVRIREGGLKQRVLSTGKALNLTAAHEHPDFNHTHNAITGNAVQCVCSAVYCSAGVFARSICVRAYTPAWLSVHLHVYSTACVETSPLSSLSISLLAHFGFLACIRISKGTARVRSSCSRSWTEARMKSLG